MSYDGINSTFFIYDIQLLLVINRLFIWPIHIWHEWGILSVQSILFCFHAPHSVYRCCSSYTKNGMSASFDDGIIWQCHPASMLYGPSVEVGRIVVVTSYKGKPTVSARKFIATTFIDGFIVVWSFEAKATVPCNDDQRISHAILNTAFVHKRHYISMYIATHHNAFCTGKFYNAVLLCHNYLFFL